jgi:hypothetical protein
MATELIRAYPIKKKYIILNKRINSITFKKNSYGFYSNGLLILNAFDSQNITNISVINMQNMEEICSTNLQFIKDKNNRSIKVEYNKCWFEYNIQNCILKLYLKNSHSKLLSAKYDEQGNIIWYENSILKNIVYIGNSCDFNRKISNLLKEKYNLDNKFNITVKTFTDSLPALSYILKNSIDIVITETNLKNISTKNFINHIQKIKINIQFMVLDNNNSKRVENIKYYKFSDYLDMIDDLGKII